jgi:hypothetical protein
MEISTDQEEYYSRTGSIGDSIIDTQEETETSTGPTALSHAATSISWMLLMLLVLLSIYNVHPKMVDIASLRQWETWALLAALGFNIPWLVLPPTKRKERMPSLVTYYVALLAVGAMTFLPCEAYLHPALQLSMLLVILVSALAKKDLGRFHRRLDLLRTAHISCFFSAQIMLMSFSRYGSSIYSGFLCSFPLVLTLLVGLVSLVCGMAKVRFKKIGALQNAGCVALLACSVLTLSSLGLDAPGSGFNMLLLVYALFSFIHFSTLSSYLFRGGAARYVFLPCAFCLMLSAIAFSWYERDITSEILRGPSSDSFPSSYNASSALKDANVTWTTG